MVAFGTNTFWYTFPTLLAGSCIAAMTGDGCRAGGAPDLADRRAAGATLAAAGWQAPGVPEAATGVPAAAALVEAVGAAACSTALLAGGT